MLRMKELGFEVEDTLRCCVVCSLFIVVAYS